MAAATTIRQPPPANCIQVHHAEMLIRRGRDGDLHHARRLLQPALNTSRELGMEPWQQRATALLTALHRRGVADHPFSSRELEVAGLVAEGLSNRAITERLHPSERTSESHVKNICDKPGFNARSQRPGWRPDGRRRRPSSPDLSVPTFSTTLRDPPGVGRLLEAQGGLIDLVRGL